MTGWRRVARSLCHWLFILRYLLGFFRPGKDDTKPSTADDVKSESHRISISIFNRALATRPKPSLQHGMDLTEALRPDNLIVLFIEQWGSDSPMPPPRGSFNREHIGAVYSQETVELRVFWEILATRGHLVDNIGRACA